jgi:hypothetical protein
MKKHPDETMNRLSEKYFGTLTLIRN